MGDNAEVFRKAIAALDARDAEGFRALIAPDAEFVGPQGTFSGRDDIIAFFGNE
jgi:ketosteroid isomerase-like protein